MINKLHYFLPAILFCIFLLFSSLPSLPSLSHNTSLNLIDTLFLNRNFGADNGTDLGSGYVLGNEIKGYLC